MSGDGEIVLRMLGVETRVRRASAVIGRGSDCDLVVEDKGASREHCEVLLREDGAWVRDLGSTHGTWFAGRQIVGETRIAGRALIHLGERGIPVEVLSATLAGTSLVADGRSTSGVASRTATMSSGQVAAVRAAATLGTGAGAAPSVPSAPPPPARGFAAGFRIGLAAGAALVAAAVAIHGFGPSAAAVRSLFGLR